MMVQDHADGIITLLADGEGTNAVNTFIDMADLEFLMISNDNDDNGTIDLVTTELDTNTYQNRLDREWKVDETGETGTAELTVDLSGTFTEFQPVFLLIDDDDDFSADVLTAIEASSWDGTTATFKGVNLDDGDYFTFAAEPEAEGPGGVFSNLSLWVKGDATNGVNNGASIGSWQDQSRSGNNYASANGLLIENGPSYNPVVNFRNNRVASGNSLGTTQGVFIVQKMDNNSAAWRGPFYTSGLTKRVFHRSGSSSSYINEFGSSLRLEGRPNPPNQINFGTWRIGYAQANIPSNYGTLATGGGGFGGYQGEIAEIIAYSEAPSLQQLQRIESYLAIKYGITLDQTTPSNYVASDGSVYWDATAYNSAYNFDIAGIIRDDNATLNNRIAKSSNAGSIMAMAVSNDFEVSNIDASRTAESLANLDAMVWANNNLATSFVTVPTSTGGEIYPIERVWQVQEQGDVADSNGNLYVAIDLKGITEIMGTPNTQDLFLLINAAGDDFTSSGTFTSITANYIDNMQFAVFEVPEAALEDGNYLTFAMDRNAGAVTYVAPGGVSTNLGLWLKADAITRRQLSGLETFADDAQIPLWDDHSDANYNFSATSANQPSFQNDATAILNFNGGVLFDGIDDAMSRNQPLFTVDKQVAPQTVISVTGGDRDRNELLFQNSTFQANSGPHPRYRTDGRYEDTYIFNQTGGGRIRGNTVLGDGQQFIEVTTRENRLVNTYGDGLNYVTDQLINNGGGNPSMTGTNTTILGNGAFNGIIYETIYYDRVITANERLRVESYLALKYGITLDQSTPQDYLASDGTTLMWDAAANTGFGNDIFGFGRDDDSALGQVQSQSVNTDGIITIYVDGEGTNAVNAFTDMADLEFLMISNDNDDNGTIEVVTTELDTNTYQDRLDREWKVDETGEVGNVELSIKLGGLFTEFQKIYLLIDDDSNFDADLVSEIEATSWDGTTAVFTGLDLNDADYFTFAATEEPATPGGVTGNLALWLKADENVYNTGTTLATDGQSVESWIDQSGESNDATEATNQPDFRNNSNDNINFNPVLEFNGNNDRLNLNPALMPSGSNARSYYGVGIPNRGGNPNAIIGHGNGASGNQRNNFSLSRAGVEVNYSNNTALGNYSTSAVPVIASSSYAAGAPANTTELWANGLGLTPTYNGGTNPPNTNNVNAFIGKPSNTAANEYRGTIAEVIVYNAAQSTSIERQKIQSYLALKYGITLDQSTPTAYLASDGATKLWDETINASYNYDIGGIARDDDASLLQKVSRSVNANSIVTMTLDNDISVANTDASRTSTFTNDLEAMTWANNGQANTFAASNLPAGTDSDDVDVMLQRIWQAQELGDVAGASGNLYLAFDFDNIQTTGGTPAATDVYLLINGTDDFTGLADANTLNTGTIIGNQIVFEVAEADLENGQFFTLGCAINGTLHLSDPTQSFITATSPIEADGLATSTITIQLVDVDGNYLTENGDGTYTATATNATAETVMISAEINGTEILDTAEVIFQIGAPNPTVDPVASIVTATSPIEADGLYGHSNERNS